MGLLNMETSAFLVCEKGLDAEPLLIIVACLLSCRQVADQIQRLLIPLGPTTPHHDGTIRLSGNIDLLQRHQSPRPETRASRIEATGLTLPRRRRAHRRPAYVAPAKFAERVLQRRPIALAIAQKDYLGSRR